MAVAELGLKVDSSAVAEATPVLERMAAASGQAEAAATRLGAASRLEASETSAATTAARVHAAALQAQAAAARMVANDSRMLAFQLNDVAVSLASGMNPAMVLVQQGSQIAQIGLRNVGNAAASMLRSFAPVLAVAAAVGLAFEGLTTKINETAKTQVSFGEVVTATMQVASESISDFFKPAIEELGGWFKSFVDWIAPTFKNAVNFIVGFFAQGAQHIQLSWALLPNALGEIAINAMNAVLKAIEDGINKNRAQLIVMLAQTGAALGPLGGGMTMGANSLAQSGNVSLGQIHNPYQGTGALIAGSTDYAGIAFDKISNKAQKLELEKQAEAADKIANSLKHANDNSDVFGKMLSDVAPLLHDANDPLTELQSNMDKLGALLAAGKISWEEYGEAVNKANLNAAAGVLGAVGQITGALSKAFEGNKALAVANAVVNTAEGITKALAQGGIFGYASAAAIGITGAAQIASILSAKPGSASVAGAGSAPATSATTTPARPAVNITLQNSGNYSGAQVEDLINQISDALADGAGSRLINVIKAA